MRTLIVAAILAAALPLPAGAVSRILFLGDSITQGIGGQGSYRDPLVRLLRGEDIGGANPGGTVYDIETLGSMTLPLDQADNSAYPNSLALFPNHEGHAGWRADQILNGHTSPHPETGAGKLADWLAAYPAVPDVVLLHIGSNDVMEEASTAGFVANIRTEIRTILDTLKAANPNVVVFLARIIPLAFTNPEERRHWVAGVDAVNTSVSVIAAEANAAATAPWVHVVDQNTGFDLSTMMTDGGHPNDAGEAFMAANWFAAMKWYLDGASAPPPEPPTEQLSIVAVGDIITQGGNGRPSYREPLTRLLAGEDVAGANPEGRAFDVRFVGSHRTTYNFSPWITDYPPALAAQPMHEGHAGWTTDDLISGFPGAPIQTGAGVLGDWLKGYTADIALVHLGSDDAREQEANPQTDFAATTRAEISAVIDALRADNPNIVVLLAKPVPNVYWNGPLTEVAAFIDDLADEKNAAASRPYIIVVDHHTEFDTATMLSADGLLPNEQGEAFMAQKWFEALLPVLDGTHNPPVASSRVTNISSRAFVGLGAEVIIPGFVISGTGSKTLLIRGVGPTLTTEFGLQGVLNAPTLTLFRNNQPIASNTGWGTSADAAAIADAGETLGAFALGAGSADSALLVSLEPGAYTVRLAGDAEETGVALMEVYDASGDTTDAHLVNLSTRAFVGTGDSVLIPGYAIAGTQPKRLLIRAVGPGLESQGLNDPLADPILAVRDHNATVVATNDNWGDASDVAALQEATLQVGAFELANGSLDAAVLVDLEPGSYTVRVSGVNDATGVVLMEMYVLE